MRVNGILIQDEALLLVQLKSPVNDELVWMPPGGGLEFGESMEACLKREFKEESGLDIEMGSLGFVNELVSPPFHAVECYFNVKRTGGDLRLGNDPELEKNNQLLKDLQWVALQNLSEKKVVPKQLSNHVLNHEGVESRRFYS